MIRYAIMLSCACLLLFACGKQNPPPTTQSLQKNPQQTTQAQRVPQTEPKPQYNQSPQAKGERLSQLASRVKKVQSATAVVLGNWAVVGIMVDPKLERSEVGVVKYSVAEALKADPQGANAIVTADPGIVQRLREMSADMKAGRPVAGISEELGDIVGRLMPQLPRSVKKTEQPPANVQQKNANKAGTPGQRTPSTAPTHP